MNKPLLFGIIGCGSIAQRHALHMSSMGKLVAVADIAEEKATALGSQYVANAYASIEALLANEIEIDVIAVCTPNGLHAAHTILALQHGKHVVCEKPMAIHAADARNMIAAAGAANRKLFVVKQNRFNPPVAALKKAIDTGVLGKVFNVQLNCFWNRDAAYYNNTWKGTKLMDGGTLFTQFSHFIDLLYWMVGDVGTVHSISNNFIHGSTIEFEDTGAAILSFANGCIGSINYTINAHEKNMEGSITVFGEKGTVKIGGQYLNLLEYANVQGFSFGNLPVGNKANDYGSYQGSMSNHDLVYANVQDVLLNNAPMATSMQDGLKTVEIIEKIYASNQAT